MLSCSILPTCVVSRTKNNLMIKLLIDIHHLWISGELEPIMASLITGSKADNNQTFRSKSAKEKHIEIMKLKLCNELFKTKILNSFNILNQMKRMCLKEWPQLSERKSQKLVKIMHKAPVIIIMEALFRAKCLLQHSPPLVIGCFLCWVFKVLQKV